MLKIDDNRGIRRLELARPEKRNAFDGELITALDAAVADAAADAAVRVIVLAAAGEVFSAGADLGWMAQAAALGEQENLAATKRLGQLFYTLRHSPKPVVARVQGPALGGGVGLVAAADLAVASTRARFGFTEARLGLLPAVISPFVVRRVGPARANAMFLLAEAVDAAEAYRVGLVDRVVEPAELDSAVESIVQSLMLGGPEALRACKELVDLNEAGGATLDETSKLIAWRRASDEAQEGMRAFLEKRKPKWAE
jgi:methylglutaconyl-CoA hydratase